ncbi:hypothetical protein [Oleidesulfovibrio sp.]|uniref:hypothetical protein n=1 Tax=Oleidesulfovibrio sp. TaxID=2909707 RepID=UPI003A89B3A2
MDISILSELKEFFTVCEHKPGKLKVRVDLAIAAHPKVAMLKDAGRGGIAGIIRTNMNLFTRTLTVEYDTQTIPYDSVHTLLNDDDPARLEQVVSELAGRQGVVV